MPHFLHLGPARCATTWQARVYSEHPSLHVPRSKDTEFFSHQYARGETWYRAQFKQAKQQQLTGELCHRYFWHSEAPLRAQKFNPDFQIITTLRDPWERLLSAYQYDRTLYLKSDVNLTSYLALPVVKATIDYTTNINRWETCFPQKNILLSFYEDLQRDPKNWLNHIWQHLAVPTHWNESWAQAIWRGRVARLEPLAHLAFSTSQVLRRHGFFQVVGTVKNQSWIEKALFQEGRVVLNFSNDDLSRAKEIMNLVYDDWEKKYGSLPQQWRRPDARA